MTTAKRLTVVFLAVPVLLVPPLFTSAAAPIIVGNGTAASCTEPTLESALDVARASGGGTIRFRCGQNPVIIPLTATLSVPNNTAIDGGGMITLDGGFGVTIASVEQGAAVLLKNLRFTRGQASDEPEDAGAVLNKGSLTIENSTFLDNAGGNAGIFNTGILAVKGGIFSDNHGSRNGGIFNTGTLSIKNTAFTGNVGGPYIVQNRGTATIDYSTFSGSLAAGVIANDPGTLTVRNSTFSGNQGFRDGLIISSGFLAVKSSTFSDNDSGGGIFNFGTGTIDNCIFSGNNAPAPPAISNLAELTVRNSMFFGNGGLGAGAIGNTDALTIENSMIFGNAGGFVGGVSNSGTLRMRNSSVTQNTALNPEGVGGILNQLPGILELIHTVVTGNVPNDIVER